MSRKRKHVRFKRRSRHGSLPPGILEAFTESDLHRWDAHSIDVQRYRDRVYYDLERQRNENYEALCAALRYVPGTTLILNPWIRLTDYRWSLTPLSAAGSVRGIGQRFNIGRDIGHARNQDFPALYLAENLETAFVEFFGSRSGNNRSELTLHELALRTESSFIVFKVEGHIDNVFDIRDERRIAAFVEIISKFKLSDDTKRLGRNPNVRQQTLVRSVDGLKNLLLMGPDEWRLEATLWDIPAAPQIFGRFLRDAGFEAVVYPSQQGGTLCVAVFPENFRNSESKITVQGNPPVGASCLFLDKDHLCLEGL